MQAAGDSEFAEDRSQMVTHGCLADEQAVRDLSIPQSLADEEDDLALPLGNRRNPCGILLLSLICCGYRFERARHYRPVQPHLAPVYSVDGVEKDFGRLTLEHDTHATQEHRASVHLGVANRRQHKDACLARCRGKFRKELET